MDVSAYVSIPKFNIMETKIIRQNNIAFIVFVVLVLGVLLSSCSKVEQFVSPKQEQQRKDTKEVHIYFHKSRAFVSINGNGKEMGNVDAQSLSVITVPLDARVSIMKYSGERVNVTLYTATTFTEYKLSDWYIL